jgi:hypothetical protein
MQIANEMWGEPVPGTCLLRHGKAPRRSKTDRTPMEWVLPANLVARKPVVELSQVPWVVFHPREYYGLGFGGRADTHQPSNRSFPQSSSIRFALIFLY